MSDINLQIIKEIQATGRVISTELMSTKIG